MRQIGFWLYICGTVFVLSFQTKTVKPWESHLRNIPDNLRKVTKLPHAALDQKCSFWRKQKGSFPRDSPCDLKLCQPLWPQSCIWAWVCAQKLLFTCLSAHTSTSMRKERHLKSPKRIWILLFWKFPSSQNPVWRQAGDLLRASFILLHLLGCKSADNSPGIFGLETVEMRMCDPGNEDKEFDTRCQHITARNKLSHKKEWIHGQKSLIYS